MMKTTLSHIDYAGLVTAKFVNGIKKSAKYFEVNEMLMYESIRQATLMAMV